MDIFWRGCGVCCWVQIYDDIRLVRDIAQNVSAISSLGPDLLIFNLLLQYIGIRIIIPLQASSKIYSYIWNLILRVNGCFVHLYSRLVPLRRHPSRASRIPDTENEADFLLSPISPINHEGYVFYIDSCLAVIYMAWKMNVRIEKNIFIKLFIHRVLKC